ncbi:MAG: hypothetical protein HC830_02310 [Bacteroidetes bacterium]|nr:hypothetical protein [Bacteroidota bacterium]
MFKYIFFILSVLLLAGMLFTSKDAGISGDEEVHFKHSELVYQYFATLGKDKSALDTPATHLQYYGQAFDNVATILIRWFSVDDIYTFRHIMCTLAGWLTIIVTAWFAVNISGYVTGILVLLLFAVSPVFLGHAHNNLKDIPFALAYIASAYFMVRVIFSKGQVSKKTIFLLACCMALGMGIRPGGLILIAYLVFFGMLELSYRYFQDFKITLPDLKRVIVIWAIVSFGSYLLSLILWPYALQNPIANPWKSYQVMTHFPTTLQQIFEGKLYWSDFLPWYYLPKIMLITIPLLVWLGLISFIVLSIKQIKKDTAMLYLFLCFILLFPPVFVILTKANLYGSWRHFLFIYPVLVLISAVGFTWLLQQKKHMALNWGIAIGMVLLAIHPLKFMVQNHPYYYLYYNEIAGGLQSAYGNYETDYYYHSMREGAEWLINELKKDGIQDAVVGANFSIAWFLRKEKNYTYKYFAWDKRCETDWDYAVIGNSYISPYQLKQKLWPPKNAIQVVYADSVPVCAVLKRDNKLDLEGIKALKSGNADIAVEMLKEAALSDSLNEVIYYYLLQHLRKKMILPHAILHYSRASKYNPVTNLQSSCLAEMLNSKVI